MQEPKIIMFRNRLQKNYRHVGKQAKRLHVSCYRVYDHDLPEFPLSIDIYENKLYVAEYKRYHGMSDEEHDEWMQESLNVMGDVLRVARENIFLKLRQKKPGRSGQYRARSFRRELHSDKLLLENEFIVHENNLKFIVNLNDYLDTGLFLDHRITRAKVKDDAHDKKLLNLFCYTGSFSVYAAAGAAAEVVSVDLSKTYLDWTERNMLLNGFIDKTKYKYEHADVKQYLKTLPENYFDIIVMDPPTFSNSKRMDEFLDIQRDHAELLNDCLFGMKTGGVLYFSTNYKKFVPDKEKIRSSSINDITKATTPFDFEGKLSRYCYRIIK
jgi:23S rRNA (guanine2069-N7)-methyltransferase